MANPLNGFDTGTILQMMAQATSPKEEDTPQIPNEGPLTGQLFLNPAIAPPAVNGIRPFAPGEYIRNPDGSTSSEISLSVTNPALNNGQPTNIPSLWIVNGKAVRVDEDTAARYAAQSGLTFPTFKTIEEADKAASEREDQWQKLKKPEDASSVAPLWQKPTTAPPSLPDASPLNRLRSLQNKTGGTFKVPQ